MIIGNFRSAQDKEAKQNLQKSLLEVEIANEAEREKRQKDFKNPYKPQAIAPQFKSNSELQKDRVEQEKQAIANMIELGFDYQKGAELTAWLSSSLINKLVAFNANFKGIKKELVETTNPKLLNLSDFNNLVCQKMSQRNLTYINVIVCYCTLLYLAIEMFTFSYQHLIFNTIMLALCVIVLHNSLYYIFDNMSRVFNKLI